MPTDVLKTHLDRHVSRVANGDGASGDVADIDDLCRPLPSRGVFGAPRAVAVHQLGELVVVSLARQSGLG
eukprot:14020667-Alexandrium_andersonii.AAC.1